MAESDYTDPGRPTDRNTADGQDIPYVEGESCHNYQGPHDWRKRLRPVTSPIKSNSEDSLDAIG